MEKKNVIALVLVVVLAGFLLLKVGFGGVSNIFQPKLNIKVSARVACWDIGIYKYCHYTRDMTAEVVPSAPFSIYTQPLAFYTNPADLSVDVQVTYPNGETKMQHQEAKVYESKWQDFYFTFPITEKGTYRWKATVCGAIYGTWQCDSRESVYTVS